LASISGIAFSTATAARASLLPRDNGSALDVAVPQTLVSRADELIE